jgi:hypothetical protein
MSDRRFGLIPTNYTLNSGALAPLRPAAPLSREGGEFYQQALGPKSSMSDA